MKREHTYHRRKDGRYQAAVFDHGKRKDLYAKSEAEIIRKLDDFYCCRNKELQTVEAYVKGYLVDNKLDVVKDTTYDRYESTYEHHIAGTKLGMTRLLDVSREELKEFFHELLKKNLSLSSVKKVKELLNQAFYEAADEGILPRNPLERLTLPTGKLKSVQAAKKLLEEEHYIFTNEEKEKLRQTSSRLWSRNRTKKNSPGILFCSLTGIRIGELLALKWDCVDLPGERIRVFETLTRKKERDGKGNYSGRLIQENDAAKTVNSIRSIWLCPEAVEILKEIKWRNGELGVQSDYVFCSNAGTQMSCRNMTRLYKDFLANAGIPDRRFHSTRATFATDNINSGVPIPSVRIWLGHSNASTTLNNYTKYNKEAELEAIEKIKKKNGAEVHV